VRLEDAPQILAALAAADMHAIQTSGNCVRNVTTDHFAGAARDEVVDPRLFAEILRQWSTDHPEFTYLPRKFKIAITGSPIDRAAVRVHDIGILAKRNATGDTGFEVYVGGGLGRTPMIGKQVRDWLAVPDFLRYIEAILRVYNTLGRRDNIYKARIKILVRDLAPAKFIRMIEEEFANLPADYAVLDSHVLEAIGARFVQPPWAVAIDETAFKAARDSDAAFDAWAQTNTHPHRQPGYLCATISLKPAGGIPGDASAEEMELIAGLAERFSMGEIRVSHEQNLILPHVRMDEAQALWHSLRTHGLATANVGLLTDIVSCPGLDYCSLAMARSIPIAQRIAERFAGTAREREIGTLDLNISGCVNACGHHHVGHLGLLGVDKNGAEFYQITVGGSADENATIGTILGPAVAAAEIVDCIDAILGAFQQLRAGQERFIDTVRRVGLGPFKEAAYGTD
jgi:sulfite reductase (NADPH) hemoprotein beta-component